MAPRTARGDRWPGRRGTCLRAPGVTWPLPSVGASPSLRPSNRSKVPLVSPSSPITSTTSAERRWLIGGSAPSGHALHARRDANRGPRGASRLLVASGRRRGRRFFRNFRLFRQRGILHVAAAVRLDHVEHGPDAAGAGGDAVEPDALFAHHFRRTRDRCVDVPLFEDAGFDRPSRLGRIEKFGRRGRRSRAARGEKEAEGRPEDERGHQPAPDGSVQQPAPCVRAGRSPRIAGGWYPPAGAFFCA